MAFDFIAIPRAVLIDQRLSHAAKIVYGRLLLYAGRNGRCCPRHKVLAEEVCLGARQLRTTLDSLREFGWISWTRTRASCSYTVHESGGKLPIRVAENCLSRSAENCHSRVAENCLQKRSIENHHQKRIIEKIKPEEVPMGKSDDEKPTQTPKEELRQIFYEKTGLRMEAIAERRIWETVELRGITQADFIEQLHEHVPNSWRNPPGFLLSFARRIGAAPIVEVAVPISEPAKNAKGRCGCCEGIGYLRYDAELTKREYCKCKMGIALKTLESRVKTEILPSKPTCAIAQPQREE